MLNAVVSSSSWPVEVLHGRARRRARAAESAARRHRRESMLLELLEPRVLFAGNAAEAIAADPSRQVVDIQADWKFKKSNPGGAEKTSFDDSGWSGVSLPHTWNTKDGQDGGSNYYRGVGWYRKSLTVPGSFAGKKVYLHFEG